MLSNCAASFSNVFNITSKLLYQEPRDVTETWSQNFKKNWACGEDLLQACFIKLNSSNE